MCDECADQILDGGARRIAREDGRGVVGGLGALVGGLRRIEVGRGVEAVLQIVDPHLRRLGVGHRAEVPGHLEMARMRFSDRRPQGGARQVHIRLERRGPRVGPVVDEAARVVGAADLAHLRERAAGPLHIGRGHVEIRPRRPPCLDQRAEVEVGVGLDAAGRAERGDAGGEVEARSAVGELGEERQRARAALRRERDVDREKMIVHAHQARKDGAAGEVEAHSTVRNGRLRCRADAHDPFVIEHDGLVRARRPERAVEDANVSQREDRARVADEGEPGARRGDGRLSGAAPQAAAKATRPAPHAATAKGDDMDRNNPRSLASRQ